MLDREKVIKGLELVKHDIYEIFVSGSQIAVDCLRIDNALAMLKDQESLLGIQQTADGITFISTGTAQQGEERGILLGKSLMHEWIYKELLHKGLLTDDIRSVFEQAKRI